MGGPASGSGFRRPASGVRLPASRWSTLALLSAFAGLSGCAESPGTPREEIHDDGHFAFITFDAAVPGDAARACRFGAACGLGEACVEGVCAESTTCYGATIDNPVRCLDWTDLAQLGTITSPFERVQLLVDGGVAGLGTEDDFRCPRVAELRANVGGEASGEQPVCGPDAAPPQADDAGNAHLCCYGSVHVAGP